MASLASDGKKEAVLVLNTAFTSLLDEVSSEVSELSGDDKVQKEKVLRDNLLMMARKVMTCLASDACLSDLESGPVAAAVITNLLADVPEILEDDNHAAIIVKLCDLCITGESKARAKGGQGGLVAVDAWLALLANLTLSEEACRGALDFLLEPSSSSSSSSSSSFSAASSATSSATSSTTSATTLDDTSKLFAMVNHFLKFNPQLQEEEGGEEEEIDNWQYMGSVLCNLARLEQVQKLLVWSVNPLDIMGKLSKQVRSKNVIRRRGSIAVIRSCLFQLDAHWSVVVDRDLVTPIVIPLVTGSQPFNDADRKGMDPPIWLSAEDASKQHEQEADILKMLIECVLLLCNRRPLREELRKRKVYAVIRNLDLAAADNEELHEFVGDPIREIVDFLCGDEEPEEEVEKEKEKGEKKKVEEIDMNEVD